MKGAAKDLLAAQSQHMNGAPLLLVCDFCGNVQYFRFDLTKDKQGLKWLP